MALTPYITATRALLQAPSSPTPLISDATLTTYINTARSQIAAEGECIRPPATLILVGAQQSYPFSDISVTGAGIGSVMVVRAIRNAALPIYIRSWEWFEAYYLGDATQAAAPVRAAQQGQGVKGTLFFNPTPNATLTLQLDVACLPVVLPDDSTVESVPYPWTDAVPFYAAWLALMTLQRQADAEKMMSRFKELMQRARAGATSDVLPGQMPQQADLALPNRLGMTPRAG